MEKINYSENVRTFLHEIAIYIDSPQEINSVLYIPVRKEIINDPSLFVPLLRKKAIPLAERLNLKKCFRLSLSNPINQGGFEIDLSTENSVATPLYEPNFLQEGSDVQTKIHIARLKTAFQRVSREEVAESIKFLSENGWNDAQFTKEFNISLVTLWRYRNGRTQRKKQNNVSIEAKVSFPEEKPEPN